MAVTCIFKYESDTFSCFQKEKWDWRGQSKKKKYSGEGEILVQSKGIWRFGVCFGRILLSVSHKSLYLLRPQYTQDEKETVFFFS